MRWSRLVVGVAVAATMAGCPQDDDPIVEESPYPDLAVTGTVLDARGDAIAGAHVVITNAYDTASADTDASGGYSMVLDGSDSASSIAVSEATYRGYSGTVALNGTSSNAGSVAMVSKEEILFSTYGGDNDIYMIRADGSGDLLQLTANSDNEVTPRRSASGHVVRWANTSANTIHEAAWDGSNPRVVRTIDSDYALMGIAWGERGTFVSRQLLSDTSNDIIIAEDPPGATFDYEWRGSYPDESPPGFGNIGPEAIHGNMLCFAGTVPNYEGGDTASGLFTAFPYFDNSFLAPMLIGDTDGLDLYPRWSPLRSDGSLDIVLVRDYEIFITHVTSSETENLYSSPNRLYGDGADAINVNRLAWAPEISGRNARIAFAVNAFSSGSTLAGAGDIVVIEYDHVAKAVVGTPQVIYDADAVDAPGMALSIDWR